MEFAIAAEGTKFWFLENFNIFRDLKDESMQELERITSMQDIRRNQPIYFPTEPSNSIFFLKKGRVKLTRISPEGKEMILALVNMGEVFGEMAFLDEGERNEFATALDDCLVCAINKNEFKDFVARNPELNLRITKLIGLKLKKYSERIEELVFKDAEQRVISFLLRLANENGKSIGEEIFVKPFLKHQDIAELTATSRQTVNAILTDLREKEVINFDRKKLIIKEKEKLEGKINF
ncbi:MAG: Crp/Fnr family transcriptional regulator [Ignavibacteria bacterium]|nr:Crp/Fnr family transcriptional regulator [Ignavibacteria bacterium]MBT8381081.1 Crp/Fnr family transcriptional regulator [Ignavibacteria bacterium]MBT8391920.1 Crp/Fnr family transcriptional regulator [Ignavibacteria bacterium]NNJ53640.1 Crp/Fnr family transcriptional regulator [Ignavibacteriaceae bacterium]NNL19979.1 Crp/Fnr family transcriptional regulator [Ignavibacteriaceae bacterium]